MNADRDSGRGPASLRLRLILLAALTLAISLGLVGLALDSAYQRSVESDLRQQMEIWVYLVLGAIEVGAEGRIRVRANLGDSVLSQPASGVYVHVHGREDHWSSPSALGLELPELETIPAGTTRFRPLDSGRDYYAFQYGVAWELPNGSVRPVTVSVLVEARNLQPQIREFRAGLWRSLGAAGLILVLAQLAFFALALRPLKRVADDVALVERGAAESLQGPYPRELEPLTRNVDRLLRTEKANQERYRQALDSLAHSLKTPLAVMRATVRDNQDTGRRALASAVDDMEHLIASRLQRASAATRRALATPIPVEPAIQRLVQSLRKVHSQVLREVDVKIASGVSFCGEERDLMEVAGNLLDNACKYGDGRVRVAAGAIDGNNPRPGLWLEVANGGEAVSPERLEEMLQRGVRGDERMEGHGLGLTIVSEVVSAYGGAIEFGASDLGGVSVRIDFPPG